MGLFGKKGYSMPKEGAVKHVMLKAEEDYYESVFPILNIVLEAHMEMASFSTQWEIQMNEENRKYCQIQMEKRVIPDLNLLMEKLKPMTGMGNTIPNMLLDETHKTRVYAEVLASVCKTGAFQAQHWENKKTMFEAFRFNAVECARRAEKVFVAAAAPEIRERIHDVLRHVYLNKFDDYFGKLSILAQKD